MRTLVARTIACAALVIGTPTRAEWFVAGYLGGAHTVDSDLTVRQPDGTHLFRGVAWESRSFEVPPYYGIQLGGFFTDGAFGVRIDYCHDKVYAQSDLAPTLQRFSLSHGLNSITVDALVRQRWAGRALYGGGGIGTVVPHVETATAAGSVEEYQWFRGFTGKALAGIALEVAGPFAVFAELRLTWIHASMEIPGGDARASFFTVHAAAGVLFRL